MIELRFGCDCMFNLHDDVFLLVLFDLYYGYLLYAPWY